MIERVKINIVGVRPDKVGDEEYERLFLNDPVHLWIRGTDDQVNLKINSSIVGAGYAVYKGPYKVVPLDVDQQLMTKEKTTVDDITVKAVPFYEVSNNFGKTIIIGE